MKTQSGKSELRGKRKERVSQDSRLKEKPCQPVVPSIGITSPEVPSRKRGDRMNHFFAVVGLPYLLFMLQYVGHIPIWDGYLYFETLVQAIDKLKVDFSMAALIEHFNFFSHPSMGYAFVMAGPQLFSPGNPYLLNLSNFALSLLSFYCFYQILVYFFPKEKRLELLLITLLFALNPLYVGVSINFNMDFPVLVFLTVMVYGLVWLRIWPFTIGAILMVFSKESGILLYLETVGAVFAVITAFFVIAKWTNRRTAVGHFFKDRLLIKEPWLWLTALLTPAGLLWLYKTYREHLKLTAFWDAGASEKSFIDRLIDSFQWTVAETRLVQMFVINGTWIIVAVIAIGICKFLLAHIRNSRSFFDFFARAFSPHSAGGLRRGFNERQLLHLWIMILVMGGFAVFNVFYVTFTNPRYVLPVVFYLHIFFAIAFFMLIPNSKHRYIALTVLILLNVIQVNSTIDPLSRAIFGTFDFGEKKMLDIGSITKECCRRDQLVYNAEFTAIHHLVNEAAAKLQFNEATTIVVNDMMNFYILTPMDSQTRRRVGPGYKGTSFVPRVLALRQLPQFARFMLYVSDNTHYLECPWMSSADADLPRITPFYRVDPNSIEMISSGHAMRAFRLQLNR